MPSDPWDEPVYAPDPWDEPGELGPIPQDMSRIEQPPDAIAREPIDVVGNPPIPADEALKIGAGQGAFGLGDEIASGIRAVRDTAMSPERKWENTLKLYQAYKTNAARDRGAAFSQHPVAYMGGMLPVAAAMGNVSAGIAPAAAAAAAPWGTNLVTNMGQSIANNYGTDTLTPGNVAKDVAFGEAAALPMRIAQHGIRRTIGDIAQLPQKGIDTAADWIGGTRIGKALGSNADELGETASKRVKDLRVAQQSYLTDSGKQAAAAEASIGGSDLPSRLAKATTEGRASIGPNGFSVNPSEFGDELLQRVSGSRSDALRQAPHGMIVQSDTDPVRDLMKGYDANRLRALQNGTETSHAPLGSPERKAMMQAVGDIKNRFAENMDVSVGGTVDNARSVLERWQAAKTAQNAAEAGGEEAAAQLARIKTGRGAIQNIAGVLGGGTAGHGLAGPGGAVLGVLAGKQLGKQTLQSIDLAGEAGQALSAMAPTLERLSVGGGPLGAAAKWVLDGKGAAQVARLATLAKMPEFQDELAADTR